MLLGRPVGMTGHKPTGYRCGFYERHTLDAEDRDWSELESPSGAPSDRYMTVCASLALLEEVS